MRTRLKPLTQWLWEQGACQPAIRKVLRHGFMVAWRTHAIPSDMHWMVEHLSRRPELTEEMSATLVKETHGLMALLPDSTRDELSAWVEGHRTRAALFKRLDGWREQHGEDQGYALIRQLIRAHSFPGEFNHAYNWMLQNGYLRWELGGWRGPPRQAERKEALRIWAATRIKKMLRKIGVSA